MQIRAGIQTSFMSVIYLCSRHEFLMILESYIQTPIATFISSTTCP